MTFQVLVSTMNQQNYDLLRRMNIQSDAVVVNQCDRDSVEEITYSGHCIKWINMSKRGVGLSRNTALYYADAEIVLWADDDMVYYDGYAEDVQAAFKESPDVDVFCFNINVYQGKELVDGSYHTNRRRIHIWNCLRYGAPTIAARRKVVLKKNVSFSLIFGGGTEFSSGEDSLFILSCLKNKARLYTYPRTIANVYNDDSTWFHGYTDKFFIDKGVFYCVAFPHLYPLLYTYYAIRFPKVYKTRDWRSILQLFIDGEKKIKRYR